MRKLFRTCGSYTSPASSDHLSRPQLHDDPPPPYSPPLPFGATSRGLHYRPATNIFPVFFPAGEIREALPCMFLFHSLNPAEKPGERRRLPIYRFMYRCMDFPSAIFSGFPLSRSLLM